MENYSEIIADAMQHVEAELEHINSRSLNRSRLYRNTHTAIVSNVKLLAELESEVRRHKADALFREQLNLEIGRIRQKR